MSPPKSPNVIEIVSIYCTRCPRRLSTLPGLARRTMPIRCVRCGTIMRVSEPRPLSGLRGPAARAETEHSGG